MTIKYHENVLVIFTFKQDNNNKTQIDYLAVSNPDNFFQVMNSLEFSHFFQ
jgi:hypothetical protein